MSRIPLHFYVLYFCCFCLISGACSSAHPSNKKKKPPKKKEAEEEVEQYTTDNAVSGELFQIHRTSSNTIPKNLSEQYEDNPVLLGVVGEQLSWSFSVTGDNIKSRIEPGYQGRLIWNNEEPNTYTIEPKTFYHQAQGEVRVQVIDMSYCIEKNFPQELCEDEITFPANITKTHSLPYVVVMPETFQCLLGIISDRIDFSSSDDGEEDEQLAEDTDELKKSLQSSLLSCQEKDKEEE